MTNIRTFSRPGLTFIGGILIGVGIIVSLSVFYPGKMTLPSRPTAPSDDGPEAAGPSFIMNDDDDPDIAEYTRAHHWDKAAEISSVTVSDERQRFLENIDLLLNGNGPDTFRPWQQAFADAETDACIVSIAITRVPSTEAVSQVPNLKRDDLTALCQRTVAPFGLEERCGIRRDAVDLIAAYQGHERDLPFIDGLVEDIRSRIHSYCDVSYYFGAFNPEGPLPEPFYRFSIGARREDRTMVRYGQASAYNFAGRHRLVP